MQVPTISEQEFLLVMDELQVHDHGLRRVFMDFMTLSALLNYKPDCFKPEPAAFQDALISVSYRLLHNYTSAGTGTDSSTEHVFRLGLLSLLTTIIYQFNPRRLTYDVLAERFRAAVEIALDTACLDYTTSLWLLFIGGITVFEKSDMPWLLSRMRTNPLLRTITSWESTRDAFGKLPWMKAINDVPGRELWNAATLELS